MAIRPIVEGMAIAVHLIVVVVVVVVGGGGG